MHQPGEIEANPAADEEDRDDEAESDRLELRARYGCERRVPIDQPDDRAREERAEDAFQTEPRGQRDERDEQDDGQSHADLCGRVLQPDQQIAQPHRPSGAKDRRLRSRR